MPRNENEYQNFVSEYAALKKLTYNKFKYKSSPKILLDFEQHMDFPIYYFGMEYIEGISLEELIKRDPLPWKWEKATNIIQRLSLALLEVNANHIIHRDLHPGNIIITEEDNQCHIDADEPFIRILDFGNKVNWFGELLGDRYLGDSFRLEGAITAWSPEYILDRTKDNDIAQDVWSLGIIFYKLLTDRYPIEVNNISELVDKYRDGAISINWYLLKDIPLPIIHILKRMLNFRSNTRIDIGPLSRLLSDIIFEDMLNWDPEYLEEYLSVDGLVKDPLEDIY